MKKVYILEQLGCANCGAKIERDVNALDVVEEAVLVFPTKQLRVSASDHTGLREAIEQIARTYESDITVRDRDAALPLDEEEDRHHRKAAQITDDDKVYRRDAGIEQRAVE